MAKATVSLAGRDILDLESFSVEEINLVLQTAAEMKKIMKRDIKKYRPFGANLSSTCSTSPVPGPVRPLNWRANTWGRTWSTLRLPHPAW